VREKTFGTYLWLREDGTPYYAGKFGTSERPFSKQHSVHRPKDRSRILIQEFPKEQDAFDAEIFLIAYYGRIDLGTGCLRNLTGGGEGGGCNPSTDTRQKMRAAKLGKPRIGSVIYTDELRQRMSESAKQRDKTTRRKSPATRKKLSIANQGSSNPASLLRDTDIPVIFRLRAQGTKVQDIADRYSMSRQGITDILYRRNWAYVPMEGLLCQPAA
jgi:hypothetical protein